MELTFNVDFGKIPGVLFRTKYIVRFANDPRDGQQRAHKGVLKDTPF